MANDQQTPGPGTYTKVMRPDSSAPVYGNLKNLKKI